MTVQSDYRSYLLRLWRVRDDGERWRATLEDVDTKERLSFPDLQALLEYLLEEHAPADRNKERTKHGPRQPEG